MQITITGGTGSLAQYAIRELEPSHDLVPLDRVLPRPGRAACETAHRFVHGDLTNLDDRRRAIARSGAVITSGASSTRPRSPS